MPEKQVFGPQRRPMPSPAQQRSPEQNIDMIEQMRDMGAALQAEAETERARMPAGRVSESGGSPIDMLRKDMPPEVRAKLDEARVQRQMAQAEAQDNWIDTPPENLPPPPPPPPPPEPGGLTDLSELRRGAMQKAPPGQARSFPKQQGQQGQQRVARRGPASPALAAVIDRLKPLATTFQPVELPSRGVFYDGTDGPRDGILHLRPMTGEEEMVLATQKIARTGEALDVIFRSCLQEKQYDPANLLSVDRTYLMIYLRGISYTTKYDVEVACPNCRTKFPYSLNLDDMWIDDCPQDFGPESLHDVMPVSGLAFRYRLSRGTDETDIQQHQQRQRLAGFAEPRDDFLVYRLVGLLEDIEGVTDKQELADVLSNLLGGDSAYLRQTVIEPPFGVDTRVDIECPNQACGIPFGIALPMAVDFFFPRPRKGSRTTARADS